MVKFIKNLSILIISLTLSMSIAEIFLRSTFVPIAKKNYHFAKNVVINDDTRGYKLKSNNISVMSNGFFNEKIIVDKNGNRDIFDNNLSDRGIIAIGDSQTFGHGISAEDSWPEQLQNYSMTNIINTGVFGYSPKHYLPNIEEQIQSGTDVKTVLYAVTANDIFSSLVPIDVNIVNDRGYLVEKYTDNRFNAFLLYKRLVHQSALISLAQSFLRQVIPFPVKYTKNAHNMDIDKFVKFTKELQEELTKRGIDLHLFYISTGSQILPQYADLIFKIRDYDYQYLGQHLQSRLNSEGISCKDLTSNLYRYAKSQNFRRESLMLPVDGHYNKHANKIIMQSMSQVIDKD